MLNGHKIIVVLPAYNAERTLRKTVSEIPTDMIDEILLVDDQSSDRTVEIAKELGLHIFQHPKNLGYGGNQKTCYEEALKHQVIVMLHPDYQYDPKLLVAMVAPICYGVYDVMLGSRIIGGKAIEGGMPRLKYYVNRGLTFFQNLIFRRKLSEYHTGYRAFHRMVLTSVPFHKNSNNFVFDNQILAQIFYHAFRVGELSCPTRYFKEASSIGLMRGIQYAWGCIVTAFQYLMQKNRMTSFKIFEDSI